MKQESSLANQNPVFVFFMPLKENVLRHVCSNMDEEGDSFATRSSLLQRLKGPTDEEAWRKFCQRYQILVRRVARRSGLSEEDSADVVQEVLTALTKALPSFEYRPDQCSFRTWLFRLIRSRIVDHFRRERRRAATSLTELEADFGADALELLIGMDESAFAAVWDAEWSQTVLAAALDAIRQRVKPQQFQIYEALALKEWPVEKVCTNLGVSAAYVYLARHRVSRALRAEILRISEVLG
jgi:RNA polymerase sigma factor (sigma-70 family)